MKYSKYLLMALVHRLVPSPIPNFATFTIILFKSWEDDYSHTVSSAPKHFAQAKRVYKACPLSPPLPPFPISMLLMCVS